jgi:hypothetical protein
MKQIKRHQETNSMNKVYFGGCHCGAVKYQVKIESRQPLPELQSCNCSLCKMTAYIHWIVPQSRFTLLTDAGELNEYQFNTGVARHLFCKHCGVKSFYIPRSNPDGVSVNARCLQSDDWLSWPSSDFDGQNWEASASKLAHLSKD